MRLGPPLYFLLGELSILALLAASRVLVPLVVGRRWRAL